MSCCSAEAYACHSWAKSKKSSTFTKKAPFSCKSSRPTRLQPILAFVINLRKTSLR